MGRLLNHAWSDRVALCTWGIMIAMSGIEPETPRQLPLGLDVSKSNLWVSQTPGFYCPSLV